MIYFVDVLLKDIFHCGRDFPWERPERCPCCGNWKVWGHGFVEAYFNGFTTSLWLKRYRCPACGCVLTSRPSSHFSRFQSSKETIRSALIHRLKAGRWPTSPSPSRQRHWLRNLRRMMLAYLNWKTKLIDAFDELVALGKTPVSSAI